MICRKYTFFPMPFWVVLAVTVPLLAMLLEVIEYGSQTFGSGFFESNFIDHMMGITERSQGLLIVSMLMCGISLMAIEQFWVTKFAWMIPTILVHLVLIGSLI